MAKDDADCLAQIRERFRALPAPAAPPNAATATAPARDPSELYGVLPADHRLPYEIEDVIFRIFDAADYREFQPEYAPEMLCANARLCGRPVAVLMSPDDLAALEDTLELLSDPAARAEIEAGRKDVAKGRVVTADELRAKYLHQ